MLCSLHLLSTAFLTLLAIVVWGGQIRWVIYHAYRGGEARMVLRLGNFLHHPLPAQRWRPTLYGREEWLRYDSTSHSMHRNCRETPQYGVTSSNFTAAKTEFKSRVPRRNMYNNLRHVHTGNDEIFLDVIYTGRRQPAAVNCT